MEGGHPRVLEGRERVPERRDLVADAAGLELLDLVEAAPLLHRLQGAVEREAGERELVGRQLGLDLWLGQAPGAGRIAAGASATSRRCALRRSRRASAAW